MLETGRMIVTVCSALSGSNRHDIDQIPQLPTMRKAVMFRRRPDQYKKREAFHISRGLGVIEHSLKVHRKVRNFVGPSETLQLLTHRHAPFFSILFVYSAFSQVPKKYQNANSERYICKSNSRHHLHRSQRLNDVQARSSDRRQKTADESHEQGKAK